MGLACRQSWCLGPCGSDTDERQKPGARAGALSRRRQEMGMRARFRRWVGICGSVVVIAGTMSGAALAFGQASASAAGSSTAFTLDLGTPTTIVQNALGAPANPTGTPPTGNFNAGDGWTFTMEGWHVGDQIAITLGTTSGGPPVECNTSPYPYGVNQT